MEEAQVRDTEYVTKFLRERLSVAAGDQKRNNTCRGSMTNLAKIWSANQSQPLNSSVECHLWQRKDYIK